MRVFGSSDNDLAEIAIRRLTVLTKVLAVEGVPLLLEILACGGGAMRCESCHHEPNLRRFSRSIVSMTKNDRIIVDWTARVQWLGGRSAREIISN